MTDPRTHQGHIGYAHELFANTTLAVDYTHIEGAQREAPDQHQPDSQWTPAAGRRLPARVWRRQLPVRCANLAGINKSRYDALTFLFRRRMPRMTVQAHYTLAGSVLYGGSTGNRSGAGLPQVWDQPFADGEWGPNGLTSGTGLSSLAFSRRPSECSCHRSSSGRAPVPTT